MKPILFNTEMVRAILDGRKTVTRRVVKPQFQSIVPDKKQRKPLSFLADTEWVKPPYQPGDILYVRETWAEEPLAKNGYMYKAFFNTQNGDAEKSDKIFKWRPSIHMPKEAARIFLSVTNVWVERLHAISNEDVLKEWVKPRWGKRGCRCAWYRDGCMDAPCPNRDAYESACHYVPYAELWDQTVKKEDRARYGWEANPWVWVIEFERISKEEAVRY